MDFEQKSRNGIIFTFRKVILFAVSSIDKKLDWRL